MIIVSATVKSNQPKLHKFLNFLWCRINHTYYRFSDAFHLPIDKKQVWKNFNIIKAGTHHQELGLPWDQPVPEELWIKVAEYCDNDVIATEAAFTYLKADWTARQILADLAVMTVYDTTNRLTTRIIFGKNRNPQNEFHYRDLSKPVGTLDQESLDFLKEACPKMMEDFHYGWKNNGKEKVPFEESSILPYFPGYEFECGKSTFNNFPERSCELRSE